MRIDVQAHAYPEPLLQRLEKRSDYPRVVRANGTTKLMCSPHVIFPMPPGMNNLDMKLEVMDKHGVDVQLLALNVPGPERVPGPEADELAKIGHDGIAEMVRKHPKRFWGVATPGFHDMDASLRELDRAIGQLGFKAVQLFSNLRGKTLDDPSLHPFYTHCQERHIPILMHPTMPVMEEHMGVYNLNGMVGFLFDTTLATLRLILSGTLDKFPRLTFVLPHVGSTIPYLMGRIDYLSGALPGGRANIQGAPSDYFKRFYVDTVASYQPAIDYCYQHVGADRMLFGTDYPWVPVDLCTRLVDTLPATPADREKIYAGNAQRLFTK